MDKSDLRLGIFSFPLIKSNATPSKNLVSILSSISPQTYLLTSNDYLDHAKEFPHVHIYRIGYTLESNLVKKIIKYLHRELRLALLVKALNKNVDTWIFFFGGDKYILPMLTAKLLDKNIILLKGGSSIKDAIHQNDLFSIVTFFSSKVNLFLSTYIVVYSQNLISEWNLKPYRHKILIAHEHFLDFETFTVTTPLAARPPLIGYIGRLSEEKGVQHFAQALPAILGDRQDIRVLIGGDGKLKESIAASLQEGGIAASVDLPGWITHDDLPNYLNQLRLLVLPSYTEGLPNIMLEAMACGTPVLATPVGAIPDIVKDEVTGFIMENNSPECIAMNVIRALNSPKLKQIADNGRRFVEENYIFEKSVEKWSEVLIP
jgi:glycosyltransferase involved in cell wall biosynthesis